MASNRDVTDRYYVHKTVFVLFLAATLIILAFIVSQDKSDVRVSILNEGKPVASVSVSLKDFSGSFEIPITNINHVARIHVEGVGADMDNSPLFRVNATIHKREQSGDMVKEVFFMRPVHKLQSIIHVTSPETVDVFTSCEDESSCDSNWSIHIYPDIAQTAVTNRESKG